MRRDLVLEVLDAASQELFEDVFYTELGGQPVLIEKSIFGIDIAAERFDLVGQQLRAATHIARALKAKFPNLRRGDRLNDGTVYEVIDWQPPLNGDGRFEIEISLKKL